MENSSSIVTEVEVIGGLRLFRRATPKRKSEYVIEDVSKEDVFAKESKNAFQHGETDQIKSLNFN